MTNRQRLESLDDDNFANEVVNKVVSEFTTCYGKRGWTTILKMKISKWLKSEHKDIRTRKKDDNP